MRLAVIEGSLCMLAETTQDGYDIGRLRVEAELTGKHLKIQKNGNGEVAIVMPLRDIELARQLGFEKEDDA